MSQAACTSAPARHDDGLAGTVWQGGNLADDFPRSRIVARDFVDAMSALPELIPTRTTLYTDRPINSFGEILVSSLQKAGYELRLGRSDGDGNRLDYVIVEDFPDAVTGAGRYTFQINAGVLRLKRGYEVDVAGVRPTTAMLMHGGKSRVDGQQVASIEPMTLVDTDAGDIARVTPVPRRTLADFERIEERRENDDTVASVSTAARASSPGASATTPANAAVNLSTAASVPMPRKRNVFESGFSNYALFLADYKDVSKKVMVFPDDSLFMGRDNKLIARQIVAGFDPEKDVISVIGCSHGKTRLKNGNEVLANGRAQRVKEEFLLAGIEADLVLDEGCWAGTAHRKMPARGVLVTHKRRAG